MSSKLNKTAIAVVFFMAMANFLFAQSTITGQLTSPSEELPFANVLLLKASDSSLLKGAVSDAAGAFRITTTETGQFLLKSSSIGYDDYFQSLDISQNSKHELGKIVMNEAAERLDDVVVEAQKPLFEQKIDRTVVNVQSSITSSAGSALDILEKSPGVTVNRSNNSLSLAGKNGVRIMINGKISRMPLDAAMQMLNGMNADNVESVELITTPPAKYEAEGNAGLINIVLKQTDDQGTNGSYSVFAGYGQREKAGGSLNFNHRNGKWNFFGNYSYRYDHTKEIMGNDRILFDEQNNRLETNTQSFRDATTPTHNAQLGLDFQAGKNTVIGANFSFFDSYWEMDAVNEVKFDLNENPSWELDLFNHEINHTRYMVGNTSISHDFDDKSNLTAELDYIRFDSNNPTDYRQDFNDVDGTNADMETGDIRSSKETPLYTWVPRLDYTLKVKDGMTVEAGLKGAFNSLENDVSVIYETEQGDMPDPDLTRKVFMSENIWAAYSSISFKLSSTLDVKAGLRYEHTITDLDTPEGENIVYRNYGQLFPSLFLNKKINDDNSWVLSYSRRVTRPTFRNIAPFVIFIDPNTFWTGNESLYPAITDAFRAEYRFKTYLLSAQYSYENNSIVGFQPKLSDDEQTQLVTVENLNRNESYSLTATLPFDVTKWWEMQYNLTGVYNIIETDQTGETVNITNTFLRANGSNTFKLPKDFTFEVSAVYWSPSYFGITRFRPFLILNFGMEKKLPNDNGSLRLSLNDALAARDFRGVTDLPEQNLDIRRRFKLEGQIFNLSYTRSFGNNQLKKLRNKTDASQEEQRRIR